MRAACEINLPESVWCVTQQQLVRPHKNVEGLLAHGCLPASLCLSGEVLNGSFYWMKSKGSVARGDAHCAELMVSVNGTVAYL